MSAEQIKLGGFETAEQEVKHHFMKAHALPYPWGGTGCIQIVTGTGYTMGWAKTEEGAWKESCRLMYEMNPEALKQAAMA